MGQGDDIYINQIGPLQRKMVSQQDKSTLIRTDINKQVNHTIVKEIPATVIANHESYSVKVN